MARAESSLGVLSPLSHRDTVPDDTFRAVSSPLPDQPRSRRAARNCSGPFMSSIIRTDDSDGNRQILSAHGGGHPSGQMPRRLPSPPREPTELGVRLIQALDAKGMSMYALENATELSRGLVSRLICGDRPNIGLTTAIKIAQALDINLDWLATGRGSMGGDREQGYQAIEFALSCGATQQTVDSALLMLNPLERKNLPLVYETIMSEHWRLERLSRAQPEAKQSQKMSRDELKAMLDVKPKPLPNVLKKPASNGQ